MLQCTSLDHTNSSAITITESTHSAEVQLYLSRPSLYAHPTLTLSRLHDPRSSSTTSTPQLSLPIPIPTSASASLALAVSGCASVLGSAPSSVRSSCESFLSHAIQAAAAEHYHSHVAALHAHLDATLPPEETYNSWGDSYTAAGEASGSG